ncbi:MAG: hypothetical protein COV43_04370 [Deltaproteobacteria bacterium CG11_big_fil_rev_8_21_14_0_20_42_23]|nr:MAG: hypothetical protein COV43_04370 [Deltaproteobacteria bacterium CG11_big_fil_rev_8_21_14_0_20_42_23]PJC65009.1 MAG: hypothetical protein CO021_00760 [Deltaproteobacteria bacterium CG_4_9_14_0_2_um_filter_42_21]
MIKEQVFEFFGLTSVIGVILHFVFKEAFKALMQKQLAKHDEKTQRSLQSEKTELKKQSELQLQSVQHEMEKTLTIIRLGNEKNIHNFQNANQRVHDAYTKILYRITRTL